MLHHLRRRAEETLAQTQRAILSTYGPAEIQTGEFSCEAIGLRLYLRIPLASDHLFNLEAHAAVAMMGDGWRLHGWAQPIDLGSAPPSLAHSVLESWVALVEVHPTRLHIEGRDGGPGETIDIEETDIQKSATKESGFQE